MKVVQSIQSLFDSKLVLYNRIKEKVDSVIEDNKDSSWHYFSRIKGIESFAIKIETGRFNLSSIFDDLFAGTLVVKNLSEINSALKLLKKHFKFEYQKPQKINYTHKDSSSFQFDDLRVYFSIKNTQTGSISSDLLKLRFEIQIKTFLQHAWTLATHDLIYKSDIINWSKERIAYQVKAILEQAEVAISGVNDLCKVKELDKNNQESTTVNAIIGFINQFWQIEDLPLDKRRLSQNISKLIHCLGIDLITLEAILIAETTIGKGTYIKNLSPFLIIIQSIINNQPQYITNYLNSNSSEFKILVTSEIDVSNINIPPNCNKIIEVKF